MYEDVIYNISHLVTAVHFKDPSIFEHYALWIYELMCHLMKDVDLHRIGVQITDHYRIMAQILRSEGDQLMQPEEIDSACEFWNGQSRSQGRR